MDWSIGLERLGLAMIVVGASQALALLVEPQLAGQPGRRIMLALVAALATVVALLPAPPGAPYAMIGLAIVAAAILMWATQAISGWLASAAFLLIALAAQIAPPLAVLSGFWSNAAALVLGGTLLGAAAERSGLGRLIAQSLLTRFASSYPRLIAGILIGAGTLSFIVPATMGRLALTIPVVAAITREAGYALGSRGYLGAMLTTVAGNFLTSYAILPANLVNIISIGAAEGQHGRLLTYGEFLLFCFPVLGLLKGVTFWALVVLIVRAPPPLRPGPGELARLTPSGRRLAIILLLTVAGWATDFVHGIQPGWIALAAGLASLTPGLGLGSPRDLLDWGKGQALMPLVAVLAVAQILNHSGASRLIAAQLSTLAAVEGRSATYGFLAIATLAALTAALATIVGAIAIVTPLLGEVADKTGLPVKLALIAEITGLQAVFFHFEAVPLLVGFMLARISPLAALPLLIASALVGMAVITPLEALWLSFLGVLP